MGILRVNSYNAEFSTVDFKSTAQNKKKRSMSIFDAEFASKIVMIVVEIQLEIYCNVFWPIYNYVYPLHQ